MSTKKAIYAGSYDVGNKPENPAIKEIIERSKERARAPKSEARKLGHMLREEKAENEKLKRRVRALEEENRRLKEVLRVRSQS